MTVVVTGHGALAQYLAQHRVDLHQLDLNGFRDWLASRIAEQENNPVFRQRCHVRDLVRRNRQRLRRRTKAFEDAERAYRASPNFEAIEQSARQIDGLQKAVRGLTDAVAERRADPRKLVDYTHSLDRARREHAGLIEQTPEKRRLERAETALDRLRDECGLAEAESRLEQLEQQRGRRQGKSGASFEDVAACVAERHILPRLEKDRRQIDCLQGVSLGCARAEFDQLIVAPPQQDGDKSTVLAVTEAKRNVNDLVDGFRMRQENIAWFTGDREGYDPADYRTRYFPEGHFDRTVSHKQGGRCWQFDRHSFDRFRRDRDSGDFLEHLYFVTDKRPLLGATGSELSRILYRVATDPTFNLQSDAILRRFRKWALSLVDEFQTADVLQLYLDADLAEQIILVATV